MKMPHKEELALLRESMNLPMPGRVVRQAVGAGRAEDWSELMDSDELSHWMMAKLKESCYQAKQDDDQRKIIVQHIMQKGTDFLRRIIVPVVGQLSHVRGHCHRFPLEDYTRWVSKGTGKTEQLVVCGVRRPVQLEDPEQSLGYTGKHGLQRGERVSGACHWVRARTSGVL